ncbi:alpha/beta hydrolase [Streptomyces roseirectus]|uniref:Alpha/beta hydrolase n=1 Tax=Streptomyces roseirectus TaxID=2768066 RepID=A0A7H0INX6_9ACTN|nr:alpha/beta hydrolase [Streptomyces roseirectus]QNP74492.1 alpha/beta hydrolase [Streptomyces roseirectus]
MTEFVLVAGAWLGAWAWDEVVEELPSARALTLSGLAEKREVPAGQERHVRDIVEEIERLDLRDVVLVGHSYSGVPVGQAAERIGDRLRRVVFVDANVPVDGESFLDGWDSDWVREAVAAGGGSWPPPPVEQFVELGLTAEQAARIVAGATPHPGATLTEPAALTGTLPTLPATYIKCLLDGEEPLPAVTELLRNPSWDLVRMDSGHWPMFSRPRELARVLREIAA